LQWASAGHAPILWCSKAGEEIQSLDATAMPLGVVPEFYGDDVAPLQLEISGMLIVTSDGIFEAPDPTTKQFGIDRMISILQSNSTKPATEITAILREAVTKWQAKDKPADDQTTIIIRRIPTGLAVAVGDEIKQQATVG
jgi:serine phosphatase RsbU (regulator of sigma subunit)